ncbi:MAG: hypothetical protein HQM04_16395 [Magnetococcales bacterium]|nr:hypothetical protein [Magnetococcales bacterium]
MQPELKTAKLSEIVFDEVIYPRSGHDPVLVQRYAEHIEEIEAARKFISVSADMKLLDGKHRWLAYRKRFDSVDREISVLVYPIIAPHDQLAMAAKLNSDHGWQLTDSDKEGVAKSLYAYGMSYDSIAAYLSVGKAKVSSWLARTVKDQKDKRDKKIFGMWMACHTQTEIAEAVNTPQQTVTDILKSFTETVPENQTGKILADHAADFDPPLYNVWKRQERTPGSLHPGNTDVSFVDNLLYLYTKPLDVVVDPFAGGGSTIDVCKKRFRRYWVSDRKPIPEREHQIRMHDVTNGLPPLARWQDVALVYLDPPYWKQMEGRYSNDPKDLANMPLEQFTSELAKLINGFAKKLRSGAVIALVLQPTQWNAPERRYTDHVADMLKAVKLPIDMRIQCPYESQQCTAQMVNWAKENRTILVLSREIVVWRIP